MTERELLNQEKQTEEQKKVGWITQDGILIEPDKNGRWPAVSTTSNGKTIVAGGDPGVGLPDLV